MEEKLQHVQHIVVVIILLLESFSHEHYRMVFHWSLSDSNSPQISWTLLSILADLNNAVVWTVSTRPVISKSSSPCTNPLVTVPRAPITIGIIVTFVFRSLFSSLARSRYLSLFSHSSSYYYYFKFIKVRNRNLKKASNAEWTFH